MALNKIHINLIAEILETILKSHQLFSDFILIKNAITQLNKPTKIIEYDFTFISKKNNRWLLIRIQDFYTHQKLLIFLNLLEVKENSSLNFLNYFISEIKNYNLKQILIFKSKTEFELKNHLERIFEYLIENSNDQLKDMIIGKIWKDIQFDWGEYK